MLFPGLSGGRLSVTAIISTSQANINFHNALVAAGWDGTTPGDFTVITDAGVLLSSTSISVGAVDTGTFPAGSTLKWTNNGSAHGRGGDGATGGTATAPVGATQGGVAGNGGLAVNLQFNITIDNTAGQIYGGGGGGGGGSGSYDAGSGKTPTPLGAGGGGGGAGRGGGAGGGGGAANNVNGSPGGNSSDAAAGEGGAGGVMSGNVIVGGAGGGGGDWGAIGATGLGTPNPPTGFATGSAGGAAGKAINLNGHTVTWLGGNDSTHVKGAVS